MTFDGSAEFSLHVVLWITHRLINETLFQYHHHCMVTKACCSVIKYMKIGLKIYCTFQTLNSCYPKPNIDRTGFYKHSNMCACWTPSVTLWGNIFFQHRPCFRCCKWLTSCAELRSFSVIKTEAWYPLSSCHRFALHVYTCVFCECGVTLGTCIYEVELWRKILYICCGIRMR